MLYFSLCPLLYIPTSNSAWLIPSSDGFYFPWSVSFVFFHHLAAIAHSLWFLSLSFGYQLRKLNHYRATYSWHLFPPNSKIQNEGPKRPRPSISSVVNSVFVPGGDSAVIYCWCARPSSLGAWLCWSWVMGDKFCYTFAFFSKWRCQLRYYDNRFMAEAVLIFQCHLRDACEGFCLLEKFRCRYAVQLIRVGVLQGAPLFFDLVTYLPQSNQMLIDSWPNIKNFPFCLFRFLLNLLYPILEGVDLVIDFFYLAFVPTGLVVSDALV